MSEMHADDKLWSRLDTDLYDVFEPNYIQAALEHVQAKGLNWGLLVFGRDEWVSMGGDPNPSDDKLTQYFSNNSK